MRSTAFDSTKGSWFDRIIWSMRVKKVRRQLGRPVDCIVDLGCGRTAPLLQELLRGGLASRAIGIDLDPSTDVNGSGLDVVRADLNAVLPLPDSSADVVLSLAVIEHLTNPVLHLREALRILKPGGRLLLTTPSPRGKPVLEFLAFRLGVIDRTEIEDHKNYFDGAGLAQMLETAGFSAVGMRIGTFQLGMNNVVSASR